MGSLIESQSMGFFLGGLLTDSLLLPPLRDLAQNRNRVLRIWGCPTQEHLLAPPLQATPEILRHSSSKDEHLLAHGLCHTEHMFRQGSLPGKGGSQSRQTRHRHRPQTQGIGRLGDTGSG